MELANHSPSTIAAVTRDRNACSCKDADRETDRDRVLAGLAEPRRGPIGVSRRVGAVAAPRLRTGCPLPSPRADGRLAGGLARARLDRDHALPSRPLGRSRPVGLGLDPRQRARRKPRPARALGAPEREDSDSRSSAPSSASPTCSSASSGSPSTRPASRSRRPGTRSRRPGCLTTRSSPTASASRRTARRSPTRATRRPAEHLSDLARDADLFVCEATLSTGDRDGEPRGHLSLDEAQEAFEASGARRLLITHRPSELDDAGAFRARLGRARARDPVTAS